MKDFRKKVARTPLADLDQDFCAYEVEITDTEIELSINAFKDIVVDDNGEILKSSSEVTPEIIVVSAPYIPIDQFALSGWLLLQRGSLREGSLVECSTAPIKTGT